MKDIFKYILFTTIVIPELLFADVSLPVGWEITSCLQSVKGAFINTKISQKNANDSVKIECILSVTDFGLNKRRLMGFDGRVNNYFGLSEDDYFEIGIRSNVKAMPNVIYQVVTEQNLNEIKLYVYDYTDNRNIKLLGEKSNTYCKFNESVARIFITQKYICNEISIYNFRVYIDGKIEGDFIPVINKESGEVAMFDKITRMIFKNSGEGYFKATGNNSKIDSGFLNDLKKHVLNFNKSKISTENNINRFGFKSFFKRIVCSLLVSLLILLLFEGYYLALRPYYFTFEYLLPLSITSLLFVFLFIFSLVFKNAFWGLALLLTFSFFGWIKSFLKIREKAFIDLFFENKLWFSFLIGLIFISFLSCFINNIIDPAFLELLVSQQNLFLKNHKSIIDFYPFFKTFTPLSYLYVFLLSNLNFNLAIFFYYSIFLSCFFVISRFFKVKISSFSFYLYSFAFLLFLFNSTSPFLIIVSVSLLIFLIYLFNFVFNIDLKNTISITLSILLVFIVASLQDFNMDVNFDKYINCIFVLLFSSFWIGFTFIQSFYSLIILAPMLILAMCFSSIFNIYLIPLSFFFIFAFLLKKHFLSLLNFKIYIPIALLFSLIVYLLIVSFVSLQDHTGTQKDKSKNHFLIEFNENITKSSAVQWHNDKSDSIKFKVAYNIINSLSKTIQKKPYKLNILTIHHVICVFIIELCVVLLLCLPALINYKKKSLTHFYFKKLLLFILPVIVCILDIFILYFEFSPSFFWKNFDVILYPLLAILTFTLIFVIIFVFKILVIKHNTRCFFAYVLYVILFFIIIFIYLWFPNHIISIPYISFSDINNFYAFSVL